MERRVEPMKTLKWLWAVYLAGRVYRKDGMLFSQRGRFLDALRPSFTSKTLPGSATIGYPDAFFFITPADVKRAAAKAMEKKQ